MKVILPDVLPEKSGVYKYTLDTGHFYIGSSKNIKDRVRNHSVYLKKGIGKGVNKEVGKVLYTAKSATFEVLALVEDKDDRIKAESDEIQKNFKNEKLLNCNKWADPKNKGIAEKVQISASVDNATIEAIHKIKNKERRTFSEMADILLEEAVLSRTANPKRKSSTTKKSS